jgi:hypothetical protein
LPRRAPLRGAPPGEAGADPAPVGGIDAGAAESAFAALCAGPPLRAAAPLPVASADPPSSALGVRNRLEAGLDRIARSLLAGTVLLHVAVNPRHGTGSSFARRLGEGNHMQNGDVVQLSQEFAEVGRALHGDGDNDAALSRMVRLAVTHIDGCDWASITVVRGGKGHTLAASDPIATQADDLQYLLNEGPCLQAAEDQANYMLFDVDHERRWPRFAAAVATHTPIRCVLSFQLLAGKCAALNLFAGRAGAFDDDSIDLATVYAAHASSLIALHEAESQAANLETALHSSREIGIALGVLMAHRKITREQAFEQLRVVSQALHRKLRDIAAEVAETGALPELDASRAEVS